MKVAEVVIYCACFMSTLVASGQPATSIKNDRFSGTSPCGGVIRTIVGIPNDAACERITWNVTVSTKQKGEGICKINATWGMNQPNTEEFVNAGTKIELKGNWSIAPNVVVNGSRVYRLRLDNGQTLSLVRLSADLFHMLDGKDHLLIGTPSWSYTLNRIKK